MEEQFLFNLNGLIKGQFVSVETNSVEVINEITKLMDSQTN